MNAKRARGRFYTAGNPFTLTPFRDWAKRAGLPDRRVLEPFAGANNLIRMLRELSLCGDFAAYDIEPGHGSVRRRDTLADFPSGFEVCVTNPPWLARNSATRRGLPYPGGAYDDLYKRCLALCLERCPRVAALVPASFLQSGLFRERLEHYILLHRILFDDTENPVCLALFGPEPTAAVRIHHDGEYVGDLRALARRLPVEKRARDLKFNDPGGPLGFVSFDDVRRPSIRFCDADEIQDRAIKTSSRFVTRIGGCGRVTPARVARLNRSIDAFRRDTADIFLTPFKGLRRDGQYRRRMEFALARRFLNAA